MSTLTGLAAGALAAVAGWGAYLYWRYPLINDVTTTPDAPPAFRAAAAEPANAGREMGYPAGFAERQRRAYPELAPREYPVGREELFRRALAAAESMPGWRLISQAPAEGRLEAVAATRWIGWKDDVVIELRPATGGAEVHLRSKSRSGRGDFGANAARIRAFLAALDAA